MTAQDSMSEKDISYRPATVAGAFYPDNPDSLKALIDRYLLSELPKLAEGDVTGIVAPHAGYVYSGWIAGLAYREVQGKEYDAVIVISPSHQKHFKGSSVFKGDAYVTPLGNAMVDKELAKSIASRYEDVNLSMDGHEWRNNPEHALEVQVPFIQRTLPGTPIVPIVMGEQDFDSQDFLMRAIVEAVRESGKKVLIIASSDLSHYHDKKTARSIDKEFVTAFANFDYYKLSTKLYTREVEACGGGPVTVMMSAAEQLGADGAKMIRYATSADSPDVKGSEDKVVGYLGGIVVDRKGFEPRILPFLEDNDKKELLKAAINAVKKTVKGGKEYKIKTVPVNLAGQYAAFVTLRKDGNLRGCMGHTFSSSPLYTEVEESAKLAAQRDPRFSPVSESELEELEYEVTILSRMQRQLNPDSVKVGRDGVYLRVDGHSGLFLPHVATEQGWDRETFLEQLGRKAGLSTDAYKQKNAQLYTFQTLLIDSKDFDFEISK